MSEDKEYIQNELDKYETIYADILFETSEITSFLDKDESKKRKFITKLPILKGYLDLLKDAKTDTSKQAKKGFFSFLSKKTDFTKDLIAYKNKNLSVLNKLGKCSKCICLSCTETCNFRGCLGCKSGSQIISCDHKRICVIKPDLTLDLNNNDTGEISNYDVLAMIEDCIEDKMYISLQEIGTTNKFILHYCPGLTDDSYAPIEDGAEFDFVVGILEGLECE